MMIPGEPEDWVMLDIEAGSTYLPEHVIRYCAQAQADGPDGTLVKIVHMIWAAAILETINGRVAERAVREGEDVSEVWPHQVAGGVTECLRVIHAAAVEEQGEDGAREQYGMVVAEVKRVLEQVEADIRAKSEAERKRMRVRRQA